MARNIWTEQEIVFLKGNYDKLTDEQLANQISSISGINRTKGAIERKRAQLGLFKDLRYSLYGITEEIGKEILNSNCTYKEACMMFCKKYSLTPNQIEWFYKKNHLRIQKSKKWNDIEIEYLKNNYDKVSISEMSKVLNRKPNSILYKIRNLKLNVNLCIIDTDIPKRQKQEKDWTEDEFQFLKDNIEILSYKEISEHLSKTEKAVRVKATKSNLIHKETSWTNYENKILEENSNLSIYDLVYILHRGEKAIRHQANKLGIKVSYRRNGKLISKPEQIVHSILKDLNIPFEIHVRPVEKCYFEADIMLTKHLCIEIQGDYWHGNPNIYHELDEKQLINKIRDEYKKEIFEDNGIEIIYIWESELNDIELVKNKITAVYGQVSQKTIDD
jgi:G:T-mismatch repair DNA endonuclease (very short patch repair protein)